MEVRPLPAGIVIQKRYFCTIWIWRAELFIVFFRLVVWWHKLSLSPEGTIHCFLVEKHHLRLIEVDSNVSLFKPSLETFLFSLRRWPMIPTNKLLIMQSLDPFPGDSVATPLLIYMVAEGERRNSHLGACDPNDSPLREICLMWILVKWHCVLKLWLNNLKVQHGDTQRFPKYPCHFGMSLAWFGIPV